MKPPDYIKRRDEALAEYLKTEWANLHPVVGDFFNKGYDYGFNYHAELVKPLIEALEFYAEINPDKPSAALAVDKFGMARKALVAIEEFMGDEE